ncbi:microcin-processing peptidase 2. Unknown type peptidase. MEROPS family U62 [Stigmatella aurantiaca]|uniref:TldD protein n=1 Tax=Stigmatella aurantiaca TaxID=41 RepID=A0A1H8C3P0_STIAU|nr:MULTISPECIES: metallopeptidase TldD-related protein [Stigmatella]SEM89693.1 microcin-processing peptidase 2. Unknown type peptidase. MEROPS family U62 [Stigmatella aurantiaca]
MPRASVLTKKRPSPALLAPLATRQKVLPPLLPQPLLERLLGVAMERGAEFAEVYVERAQSTAVILEEGRIKSGQTGLSQGVGVRVIAGPKVGYAYSDDLDEEALLRAARTAAMIAQGGGSPQSFKVSRAPAPTYYKVATPLADIEVARKAELVLRADKAARAFDARVKQVNGSYADVTKRIAVGNTQGHYSEDTQDLCRLSIQVMAEGKNKERRTGFYGGGGRVSFNHFDTFTPESVAREAARQAIATLGSVECQAGPQTVVLAPGWSGILLHEAVGHGLEADFIRKGTSLFAGKLGEKVASDLVTVIDDGTMANNRGSINVDDEGAPGQHKVLIEKGVLKGYLYDQLNAKLMGQRSTGSGRRESFKHMPLPRMTNTYLAPGDHAPEDILKEVKRGLYCAHFGGGQVDITNGNFVFEVSEAYQIEDGKLGKPVKNAILIGVGPEALKNVSRVGNDPMPDPGLGTCGKDGQSVPVGVGLPTLRIDNMTVGGTKVA